MDLALNFIRTHVQSSLYIRGTVNFPETTFAEQYVTNEGFMVGVDHWYSRGHTKLISTGQSSCSTLNHPGMYYFTSFTTLCGGFFSIADESSFNSTDSISVITDTFHMEGQSHGFINKSANIMGRVLEIEKQSILDGTGEGYGTNSGLEPGCTSSCGSGGGHGGSGGSCSGCGSCAGGGTYGSVILPSVAGSGGGICSHGTADIGGRGGSAVRLAHTFTIVEGTVTMNGEDGMKGGGGGAGGSVWLDGEFVEGWGKLVAQGGKAYSDSCLTSSTHRGGGGGGGRVRTWGQKVSSKVLRHQTFVTGGSGSYRSGTGGSTYDSHGEVCSGSGTWNSSSLLCDCKTSFVGYDCQFYCENDITCRGNGICNENGQCECNEGFVGTHCDSQCHRDTDCSGNGECSTCGSCVCDPCFSGPDCSVECGGFGTCVANQCLCDNCHLGIQCESECNGQGTCNASSLCSCSPNWGGDKCTIKGCPGPNLNCNEHGICNSGTNVCFCEIGWLGM